MDEGMDNILASFLMDLLMIMKEDFNVGDFLPHTRL